jgi:glycosyltransferase involved in cell wall biosynthesis
VPGHLGQADILLNTTNFDNTPVSILEAMACGLPVVSTNVGGISHLLEDGSTALLVPPANAEEMANAVTRLLREPDLAVSLARNGRRQVEVFDWKFVVPRWERLLEGLISNAHGQSRSEVEAKARLSESFTRR